MRVLLSLSGNERDGMSETRVRADGAIVEKHSAEYHEWTANLMDEALGCNRKIGPYPCCSVVEGAPSFLKGAIHFLPRTEGCGLTVYERKSKGMP